VAEHRYTKSHEWCVLEDGVAVCGLSKHAAEELQDLTYLEYRVEAGEEIAQGAPFGEVDSVKTTSELFAPVAGKVAALNDRWTNEEELPALTEDPESTSAGWLIKIEPKDPAEAEGLMTADAYAKHVAESE